MVWLIGGITLFIISLLAFLGFLGLWVYMDAQAKSNQSPVLWTMMVLFVPNLLGLIAYLLVGRTKKHAITPRKYIRYVIASGVFFALGVGALVGGVTQLTTLNMGQIGTFVGHEENFRRGLWEISAERINGTSQRTIVLNAEEMENFHVAANQNILLHIEQGTHSEVISIPGGFDSHIDLYGFDAGEFIFTLEFENTENVIIAIRWR
ncbi:MAG: hypothetical protein FWF81_07380 [Defluviitaleaceae bacterium]|nr:hypothetical protein [Defluviitaleaceae bacterium]